MSEEQLSVQPRFFLGSRLKAFLGLLVCAGFMAMGWWLTKQPSTHFQSHGSLVFAGWLAIIFFGLVAPLWFGSIVRPYQLEIDNSGFRVKQALLPEMRYYWSDIDDIQLVRRMKFIPMVTWTFKATLPIEMRRSSKSTYLPWGWRDPTSLLANALGQCRDDALSSGNDYVR